MKRALLLSSVLAISLASCAVTQKVGFGSGNFATETAQGIIVTTTDKGTEKVHLGLSGANDAFLPSVFDKDGKKAGDCKVTEAKLNIWNCDLGVMLPGDERTVRFEGKLLSGNFVAYELKTNKLIIENVKVR